MSLPYASSNTLPLGSGVITIGTAFNAESVNVQFNAREVRRADPNGDPQDLQVRGEPIGLTATLQRATVTTAMPNRGATFTFDGVNFVLVNATLNKPQGDYHTFDITATTVTATGGA